MSGVMLNATLADKAHMQQLNNRLSDYMLKMRKLGKGAAVDPAKYHEMMRMLEDEVNKMRNAYEAKLEELRKQLEAVNREKNTMAANQGTVDDLQRRAAAEADKARSLQDDINRLQRALAEKERENAELRASLQVTTNELNQVKPHYERMMRDGEDWKKRFENEAANKKQAEDKIRQLDDKIKFDEKVKGQELRDLQDRLRAANDIIKSLEDKVNKLSNQNDEAIKQSLQRMREGTMAEMRKHQKDTEEALNRNLEALKRQIDDETRKRDALNRERDALADKVHKLEEALNKMAAEKDAANKQREALENALYSNKSRADQERKNLEQQIKELQDMNMEKVKDLNNARDAQGSLKCEIDTYQRLLDGEGQLEGKASAVPPRVQSIQPGGAGRTGSPHKGMSGTPPTTYRTSFKNPNKSSLMNRSYQYPANSGQQRGFPEIPGSAGHRYSVKY